MNEVTTIEDINFLLANNIQENHLLEYKSGDIILNDKGKKIIAKAVSALANAEGGQLIIGIKEKKNQGISEASELAPVVETPYSKEWLEQVILTNISPLIDGLKIISIPSELGKVVYIVNVPKSSTAHQNTIDFQYYRRRNFKAEPMLDFEIREVMNRVKHPQLVLEFRIATDYNQEPDEREYRLISYIRNIGSIYATHINYSFVLPVSVLPRNWELDYNEHVVKHTNLYKEMVYIPILPGCTGATKEFKIEKNWKNDSDLSIKWKIYADNAPMKENQTMFRDIKIHDIS